MDHRMPETAFMTLEWKCLYSGLIWEVEENVFTKTHNIAGIEFQILGPHLGTIPRSVLVSSPMVLKEPCDRMEQECATTDKARALTLMSYL